MKKELKPILNLEPSDLSALDLYRDGRAVEQEEHDAKEKDKLNTLRGGSSGCVGEDGEIYGTCARFAMARYKGHQPKIQPESFDWFDAGFANEGVWEDKIKASRHGYEVKFEEECPISWEIDGVPVTGRPDVMLFDEYGPVLGLELKAICTVNSAIGVYCEDKPKTSNVLQTAHYSQAHGCPFILVYSYRGRSRVPGWAERQFKDKLRLSYERTFTNSKTGKEFTKREYAIDPFTKEFKLGFDGGLIYYVTPVGDRVDTVCTAGGIKEYYRLIVDCVKNELMPPRISRKDITGKRLPYDPCKTCPFVEACDRYEEDYQAWLDKVEVICNDEHS